MGIGTYNNFLVNDMLPLRPSVDKVRSNTHDYNGAAPLHHARDELEGPDEGVGDGGCTGHFDCTLFKMSTKVKESER